MGLDNHERELIERGVVALERLAQDPVIEIEAAPPVCPHCNNLNPKVTIEKDADGPLGECVLQARCENCGRGFFAIPITWQMATSVEEVKQEMAERAGIENVSNH